MLVEEAEAEAEVAEGEEREGRPTCLEQKRVRALAGSMLIAGIM